MRIEYEWTNSKRSLEKISGGVLAFLWIFIKQFLNIYFGFGGLSSLFGLNGLCNPFDLLNNSIGTSVWYVRRTINESYREEAKKFTDFNVYFLRGCFFAVLFIGCVDFLLALLRSIDVLKLLVGDSI